MDDATWALLEPALKRDTGDRFSRGQIEQGLAKCELTLWRGEHGAAVTYFLGNDRGRFIHCWLGGGSLRDLMTLRPGIEAWGRAHGAQFASINGRRGWDRAFAAFGYSRRGDELEKTL